MPKKPPGPFPNVQITAPLDNYPESAGLENQEQAGPYVENNPVNYELLLTDRFLNNQIWLDFMDAMGALFNPNVQAAADELVNIRDPYVSPTYAALNARMLGFSITNAEFSASQYLLLMKHLGEFWLTRGASSQFINFLNFLIDIQITYTPLWANLGTNTVVNDLSYIDVASLSPYPGTPVWEEGGTWFPTPYYDGIYNPELVPYSTQDLYDLLYKLQPIHLVLRNLGGLFGVTADTLEINAFPVIVTYAPPVVSGNSF